MSRINSSGLTYPMECILWSPDIGFLFKKKLVLGHLLKPKMKPQTFGVGYRGSWCQTKSKISFGGRVRKLYQWRKIWSVEKSSLKTCAATVNWKPRMVTMICGTVLNSWPFGKLTRCGCFAGQRSFQFLWACMLRVENGRQLELFTKIAWSPINFELVTSLTY